MSDSIQKLGDATRRRLAEIEEEYDEAMEWRDWGICDALAAEREALLNGKDPLIFLATGVELIARQRERQGEHHSDGDDDKLTERQLAERAVLRLEHALKKPNGAESYAELLAKAGALIAAELDRLQRIGKANIGSVPNERVS